MKCALTPPITRATIDPSKSFYFTCQIHAVGGFIVIEPDIWQWDLPIDLADFIITNLFEQPRLDSSALIRGRLPNAEVSAWLYTANCYQSISTDDHEKFRRAARSRGGGYSMELCEFVVEDVLANGDVLLNFWRRVRDDTGEGGRVILSERDGAWCVTQQLGGWENHP